MRKFDMAFLVKPTGKGLTGSEIHQLVSLFLPNEQLVVVEISGEKSSAMGFITIEAEDKICSRKGGWDEFCDGICDTLEDVGDNRPTGVYDYDGYTMFMGKTIYGLSNIRVPLREGVDMVAVVDAKCNTKEITVGIEKEGVYTQDIALIREAFHYGTDGEVVPHEKSYEVFIWQDAYDEECTCKIKVFEDDDDDEYDYDDEEYEIEYDKKELDDDEWDSK